MLNHVTMLIVCWGVSVGVGWFHVYINLQMKIKLVMEAKTER